MADIASATFARLTADAPVSAVVGSRVYPINRPQNSDLPAIRYQIVSDNAELELKGETSVQTTRLQFDCFARSYSAARQLGDKVKAALLRPATIGGVIFGGAEAEGPIDEEGSDTPNGYIFRTRVDLLVRHRLA